MGHEAAELNSGRGSWSSRLRRTVRPKHLAAGWAAFTVVQTGLLVRRLVVGDGLGLGTIPYALAVLLGLFLVAAHSARFELREESLRTRSWLFRSDRPWSQVEAIDIDWREKVDGAPAATITLADNRTRRSAQWDPLADEAHAEERNELRRTLERTAGQAGVVVTIHEP